MIFRKPNGLVGHLVPTEVSLPGRFIDLFLFLFLGFSGEIFRAAFAQPVEDFFVFSFFDQVDPRFFGLALGFVYFPLLGGDLKFAGENIAMRRSNGRCNCPALRR